MSSNLESQPSPTSGVRCPISVLDLAVVAEGATSTKALAETTITAQRVEELGYERIWVAEHHNLGGVASTVPGVLLAHLGAHTSTIRLGSGGVMLPNHAPLAIAEQFALLEALHPGRIDLGIGRAPGTDRRTAAALRRGADFHDDDHFPRNLVELLGLLGDARKTEGCWDWLVATPEATSYPSVKLLGSSGFSAQLAGILGLPFAFAHHFDMGGTEQAVQIYHDSFEPSAVLAEPYTIVSASVLAADTEQEAQHLVGPSRLRRLGIRTGQIIPLMSPEKAAAHPAFPQAAGMATSSLVGTAEQVVAGLDQLAELTSASELMIYTSAYALEDRLHSFELLAKAWHG